MTGATQYLTPVELPSPISNVTLISSASGHALYDAGGTLYACGGNSLGELGDGNTKSATGPVAVTGLTGQTVVGLYSSSQDAYALTESGAVYAWGGNAEDELCNGSSSRLLRCARTGAGHRLLRGDPSGGWRKSPKQWVAFLRAGRRHVLGLRERHLWPARRRRFYQSAAPHQGLTANRRDLSKDRHERRHRLRRRQQWQCLGVGLGQQRSGRQRNEAERRADSRGCPGGPGGDPDLGDRAGRGCPPIAGYFATPTPTPTPTRPRHPHRRRPQRQLLPPLLLQRQLPPRHQRRGRPSSANRSGKPPPPQRPRSPPSRPRRLQPGIWWWSPC